MQLFWHLIERGVHKQLKGVRLSVVVFAVVVLGGNIFGCILLISRVEDRRGALCVFSRVSGRYPLGFCTGFFLLVGGCFRHRCLDTAVHEKQSDTMSSRVVADVGYDTGTHCSQ